MKNILSFIMLTIIFVLIIGFSSCTSNEDGDNVVTITDMVGDTVNVNKNASKVAVLARSAVDMMVAFGLGDKVDGVYYTALDNDWMEFLYPQSVDYFAYSYDTTIETYLARGVDLIIAPEQYLAINFREHGICSFTISQYGTPNYDDKVFALAEIIKQIWDNETTINLVNDWEDEFNSVKDTVIGTLENVETTKTIYYVRGDKNKGVTYTENTLSLQDTFAKYLKLDCAGKYFSSNQPSTEAFLSFDPDYIIVGGIYQKTLINTLTTNSIYSQMTAVENDQIFNIGVGFVMFEQTSVENTIYLAYLANKIYPDRFGFNIVEMLKNTIQKYFGKAITTIEAEYMLNGRKPNGENLV